MSKKPQPTAEDRFNAWFRDWYRQLDRREAVYLDQGRRVELRIEVNRNHMLEAWLAACEAMNGGGQ